MQRSTLAGHALAALAACASSVAHALPDLEGFRDPQDGRFDASHWLLERKGFLPVPIIVTEPAVGYGAGAALLFFDRNAPAGAGAAGRATPPDITGVAAFATENGSRAGGIGHLGFTADRRWRYAAGAGYGSMNLAWYGAPGIAGGARAEGLAFNIEAAFGVADVRRRIGESEWWAGMRYVTARTTSRFGTTAEVDGVSSRELGASIAAAGVVVEYDGRDNIFTPNRGVRMLLQAMRFSQALGSDHEFGRARASLQGFWPLGADLVIGLRGDLQAVDGDVPFYARPFIELRGIPVMRYQGDRTIVAEVEGRWNLDGRWSAIGFAGAGRAAARGGDLGSAATRATVGIGVRYLVARMLGLHMGMDVARGPEETAFYLIVGSAWR